jgi:hypothetical protein
MLASGAAYAKKDLDLAHSFADASKQAGIARIIYLGGLGETTSVGWAKRERISASI